MYLLSSDESELLNNESDKLGSDSVSFGMYSFCAFSLCFDNYVGSVGVLGSDVFIPTGFEYKGDIFVSKVSVRTGVKSKVGQLFEMF